MFRARARRVCARWCGGEGGASLLTSDLLVLPSFYPPLVAENIFYITHTLWGGVTLNRKRALLPASQVLVNKISRILDSIRRSRRKVWIHPSPKNTDLCPRDVTVDRGDVKNQTQNVSPVYTPAFQVSGTPGLTVLDIFLQAASGGYTFRGRCPIKSIRNPSYLVTLAQSPTHAVLGHVSSVS